MNRNSRGMRRPNNGGPLMTSHLKDIDLELELLKRKREMIEQQQMLMMDEDRAASRQFDYNSMVYEDRKPHGSNSAFGKKRGAEPHWDYDRKRGKKSRGSQSNFNQHSLRPYVLGRAQRPGPSGREDYSAVPPLMDVHTKPPRRAPVKPGKPFSPSRPERVSTAPVATKTVHGGINDMLLPDKTPSPQVNGRLELALGMVLKDIREVHGNQPAHLLRSIKEAIRERIRAIMLGKVVGNLMEIMKMFREQFPPETDIDIINIAQAAYKTTQSKQMKPSASDAESAVQSGEGLKSFEQSVEGDLKQSFIKLIENQLKDMLVEMEQVYYKKKLENQEKTNTTVPSEAPEAGASDPTAEAGAPAVEAGAPAVEAGAPAVEAGAPAVEAGAPAVEAGAPAVEAGAPAVEAGAPAVEAGAPAVGAGAPVAEADKFIATYQKERSISDNFCKLYKIVDAPDMREIMPRLIKKHLPLIANLLFQSDKFSYEREKLVGEVRALLKSVPKNETRAPVQPYLNRALNRAPYFVKVMGCPVLPKKWAMQVFLDQFNPSVVKKHKAIHNLLFVGLREQQDYDSILAANGSRIGNIVISTKSNQKLEDDEKEAAKDTSDPIDAELDNQISDLLNAIRNSEENTSKSDAEDNSKDEEVCIIEDEAADIIDLNADDDPVTNDDNLVEDTNTEKPESKEETENLNTNNDVTEIADSPVTTTKEVDITENVNGNSEDKNAEGETGSDKLIETNDNLPNNDDVETGTTETNDNENSEPKNDEELVKTTDASKPEQIVEQEETGDKLEELNTKVTRSSARLASTPSRIRTRRSSKMAHE